jgi:hypothetical protein
LPWPPAANHRGRCETGGITTRAVAAHRHRARPHSPARQALITRGQHRPARQHGRRPTRYDLALVPGNRAHPRRDRLRHDPDIPTEHFPARLAAGHPLGLKTSRPLPSDRQQFQSRVASTARFRPTVTGRLSRLFLRDVVPAGRAARRMSMSEVVCTDVRTHLHTPIWSGASWVIGGRCRWHAVLVASPLGCLSRVVRTRTTSTVGAGRYRANPLSAFSLRRIQLCFEAKAQLNGSGPCSCGK